MQDFELENQLATQRYQKALAAQQQSGRTPMGEMVGNRYVKSSPFEHLAEALRLGLAGREANLAKQEIKDLQTKKSTAMADALRTYTDKATGAPAFEAAGPAQQGAPMADPLGLDGGAAAPSGGYTVPERKPDMRAAYGALMNAPDAAMRSAGMTGMAQIPQLEAAQQERVDARKFRADEAAATRQARLDALAQQHQDRMAALEAANASRQQMAQEQRQFQMQMAQMNLANRPERNLTVMGPDGAAITMPQSQAQGMQLYNPQAAAQLQKTKTKAEAKEQLSGVVQQLANSYTALEQGGGITSTNKGVLDNLGAAIGSSGIGQAVGGAVGTENQRQRQTIEQTRPLLLNFIKEATGMSAQQMNSNAEMMLYLKAATDPKLSVEANRQALTNLDKMFGLGLMKMPEAGGKVTGTPQKTVVRTGTANGRKVVEYSDGTTAYAD